MALSVRTASTVDAVLGEELAGSAPETGATRSAFVVEDLAVSEPAVGIDRGVDVVVTDPSLFVVYDVAATAGTPAAAGWDTPELLDVDVHELAGPVGVDTTDHAVRSAGPSMRAGSGRGDTRPDAPSTRASRRCSRSSPDRACVAVATERSAAPPGPESDADIVAADSIGPRGRVAFGEPPPPPLVGRLTSHTHLRCDMSDWAARPDPLDHDQSAAGVIGELACNGASRGLVLVVEQPHDSSGAQFIRGPEPTSPTWVDNTPRGGSWRSRR